MDNKKDEPKFSVTIDSVYTLDKNKVNTIRDFKDKNNYLYKDGIITNCPFISGIGMDWGTKLHGLLSYPCGTHCQHFHIKRDMKKVSEKVEGSDTSVDKLVPTGKIKVGLSCGSGGVWFDISGLVINEQKTLEPNPSESHLKVTKNEGGLESGK